MVHSFFTNKNLAANELCYPLSTSLAYKGFNRRGLFGRLKIILGFFLGRKVGKHKQRRKFAP